MAHVTFGSAAGLLALALALPAAALAAEDTSAQRLHLGPVNVNLSLAISGTYSDNAFATAENPESDFYTTVTPEIRLTLFEEYNIQGFTFGVSLDSINARHFEDLTRVDWKVYGNYAFTIKELLKVEIGDTYTPRHIEPLESTSGQLEKYTSNEAYVNLKYDFLDLWQARLGYKNTIFDYADAEYRSRVENLISAGVYFRILSKTAVFGNYEYTDIVYDDPASTLDNVKQNVFAGATWEITEITRGTVSGGYELVDFKDPSEGGWSTWSAAVDVRHELTELATVSVKGERSIEEGKYDGTRYLASTGLSAGLTYQFLERLAGNASAGYFLEDFSDPNPGDAEVRNDRSARAGLGLIYTFRSWLQFEASYDFVDRNSNIDRYDALENTIEITATARY